MRFRLRQCQCKLDYAVLAAFVISMTFMFRVSQMSPDHSYNTQEEEIGRGHHDTGRVQPIDVIIPQAKLEEQKHTYDYDGPFPDARVPEGVQQELVDYHDYEMAALDKARVGLGEQGVAAYLPSGLEKELNTTYWANGFNGLLSDHIALDRALKDIRHPECATYKYYQDLPTVSVVIPFFEEQLSALQRTLVSVINRSPAHLLKEIILVDDGSTTREDLNAPLEQWLAQHAPMTRVLRLPEREGLIAARLAGAKAAVGDVILVLDSHCEVMNNWLPPLLNPIVEDYRTAVCPLIDIIEWNTFNYFPQDNGGRGAFDWHFIYRRLPLSPEDAKLLPKPFPNPVMNGGLFAISRKFFWELGGYDPGIEIWGGEQYNLSFKIWQCGGRLLDAPCSRVGHVFRGHSTDRPIAKQKNFINKNYKRVGLVWMDEFIEGLYKRMPGMRTTDPGDISGELAIRERLKCKPFKWFMEEIAPDFLKVFPIIEPEDFANGTIRNLFNDQCVDTGNKQTGELMLYPCHGGETQQFAWCWRKFIREPSDRFCIEVGPGEGRSPTIYHCVDSRSQDNQVWTYIPLTKQLQSKVGNLCIEAESSSKAIMAPCVEGNRKQQWEYQHVNMDKIREVFPELRI